MFEDSQGDVWVTTWKEEKFGLARWLRAPSTIEDLSSTSPTLLQERGATSLAEVPDGQLWLGLGRPGGLFRRRDNRFEQINGPLTGTIQALYRDRANRLWIASAEAGLGRIDNPADERVNIRVYNRSRGLSSNEIWCVTEDLYGRIYAGTARGVDRIDPSTHRIIHYSSVDGLAAGDIRAALRSRTGELWFLSNRGLSRFRPDYATTNGKTDVRITGIRVAGAVHPISELGQSYVAPAEFGWNRNSVQIDFSAISFQSSDPVQYEFLLEGAGDEWSEPSLTSTVHFSNLGPGRYRFLVRAAQRQEQTPAEFVFTITSPPWQRWWFQGGIAALLLAIAYLILRARMERQLALERVRSGIATDLHDDIGASLSRIAVVSEALKSRVSPEDGDSKRMLNEMAESSRSLVNGMSDIVWSIDPRRDHLGDVVARLRAFGSDVLEPCGIHWTCQGPSDILDRTLTPNQRRELYLIFKEAIHNVERHSGASNVVLKIACNGNHVSADLQDDGQGVAASKGSVGLGLSSMQARAQRLRGEIQISSRPEGGTRAFLSFPLKTRNA
jgi:signal transduction histidine kinase